MKSSYTTNYLKIYLWQSISLVTNFLSMFVVMPFLSSEPAIFGVYSLCISVSIFLSYADFGFMSAGQKYAAEYFSKGDLKNEIKVTGFSSFILLIFLILIVILFIIFSYYPNIILKELTDVTQIKIASKLFALLIISTFTTFFQRISQIIFGVRVDDYLPQRIIIISNLLRIFSVLVFFNKGKYDIVGYFFVAQSIALFSSILPLIIAYNKYQYNFKLLFKSIKFDKQIYNHTKKFAFSGLFLTILWILYYESDSPIIGKFLGAKSVAIYAIGISLISFFRGILGILFSPFSHRFNHFIGLADLKGLETFYKQIVLILAPLIVFPIVAFFILAKPLILTWVGLNYIDSINIAKPLILCNLLAFISYPAGMLIRAQEKIKAMNIISIIMAFFYWIFIFATYHNYGVKSFAFSKFILFQVFSIFYLVQTLKFLKMNIFQFIIEIIYPMLFPLLILVSISIFIVDKLPTEKSKENLFIVTTSTFCIIGIAYIIQILTSKKTKSFAIKTINNIFK